VSTALVKLERPEKKAYFHHGTRRALKDGSGPTDYGTIKQALERDNFTTATINLLTQRAVPDDASELIIAGPAKSLPARGKGHAQSVYRCGGKLIVCSAELEN